MVTMEAIVPLVQGHRAILERNTQLLVKNMVPGEDLLHRVGTKALLTDTMLKEVQSCNGQELRNRKLLELLKLRLSGASVLESFCDCLQLSGHSYIADMLRDEVAHGDSLGCFDIDEVMKKLPRIAKVIQTMTADDRNSFKQLLQDKVREMTVKQIWRHNSRQKTKAMDAKSKQLEENWKFSEVLREKDQLIETLRKDLDKANKQIKDLSRDLENVEKRVEKEMDTQKEALQTQMKFNSANDSTLMRLEERHRETESILAELLRQMLRCLNGGELGRAPTFNYKDTSINTVDKVMDVMEAMMERLDDYQWLQKKHTALQAEKEALIRVMGGQSNQTDMNAVFTEFCERKQRKIAELEHKLDITQNALDVTKKSLSLKNRGSALLNSSMSRIKEEDRRMAARHQIEDSIIMRQKVSKKSAARKLVHKGTQTVEVEIITAENAEEQRIQANMLEDLRTEVLANKEVISTISAENEKLRSEIYVPCPEERTNMDLRRALGNMKAVIGIRDEEVKNLKYMTGKLQGELESRECTIQELSEQFGKITAGMEEHGVKYLLRRRNSILANHNIDIDGLVNKTEPLVKSIDCTDKGLKPLHITPALPKMSKVSENISMYNKGYLLRKMGLVSNFDLQDPVALSEPDMVDCKRAANLCRSGEDVTEDYSSHSKLSRRSVGISLPPLSGPFPNLQLRPTGRQVSIPSVSRSGGTLVSLVQTSGIRSQMHNSKDNLLGQKPKFLRVSFARQ